MSRGRTGLIKAIKEVRGSIQTPLRSTPKTAAATALCCRHCSHPRPACASAAQVFREVKFFGDAEIATLKKELEAHKLQLEQLKAQRAEMARREEQLVSAATLPRLGGHGGAGDQAAGRGAEHACWAAGMLRGCAQCLVGAPLSLPSCPSCASHTCSPTPRHSWAAHRLVGGGLENSEFSSVSASEQAVAPLAVPPAQALLEMRKAVEHLQQLEGLLAEQDQRVSGRALSSSCTSAPRCLAQCRRSGSRRQCCITAPGRLLMPILRALPAPLRCRPMQAGLAACRRLPALL